jgi:hypothetical protein
MPNYDLIGVLYDTAQELVGVRYSMYDAGSEGQDGIDAIELRFEVGVTATVYVEVEFDTLRLELSEMELGEDHYSKDAITLEPWRNVLGGTVSWIWLLTNQQGYEDGIRFELSSADGHKESSITLIGMASKIEIYSSKKINP